MPPALAQQQQQRPLLVLHSQQQLQRFAAVSQEVLQRQRVQRQHVARRRRAVSWRDAQLLTQNLLPAMAWVRRHLAHNAAATTTRLSKKERPDSR